MVEIQFSENIEIINRKRKTHTFWVQIQFFIKCKVNEICKKKLISSFYISGGKDSKSVLEYDEKNDKWSKLNDLKVSRAGYLLELPRKMNKLSFDWWI